MVGRLVHKQIASQADNANPQVFDRDHFDRQTFGEQGLQREIMQLFLVQLADTRKCMSEPMSEASWRYLAHTLKGAAAAVGAMEIAVQAEAWEVDGQSIGDDLRQAKLHQFDGEIARFCAEAADFMV